jgi:prolyl oligopeptidase
MRKLFVATALIVLTATVAAAQTDAFAWLEEIHGARALAWVAQQNARTAKVLEADPRFETYRREALAIFTAKDRIAFPTFRAGGIDNLWQDETNTHGLWRHTTLDGYNSGSPAWTTLIDLDQLSKAEGKSWFWKGATCLQPEERYCLIHLSNGGGDAVEVREFDTQTRQFVQGGFHFPVGKQYVDWIDKDALIVGRDWSGAGADLTASGYPDVLKIVRRGQPQDQAHEVYRATAVDVWAQPRVLRDPDGRVEAILAEKGLSFFTTQFDLLGAHGPVTLPFPQKARLEAFVDGQLVVSLQQAWGGFKTGDLISFDLAALKRDPASAQPTLVFEPDATQALESVEATRDRLVVNLLENVKGAVDVYVHAGSGWTKTRLALPQNAALAIRAASKSTNRLYATAEGFLDPTSLWFADVGAGTLGKLSQLPARFDASRDVVEQYFATSNDGTKVPYFLVRPKGMKRDGSTPVQMFGYGGFQISEVPIYRPEMGKLWLEKGGAYVLADIRGGGEFGPAWHDSALREHRQRAFDDFASVAKDLIARRITSPKHLGIYGRSNGGVLMSVSMTQHPELFGAVVIESPLIDMLRYNHLSAGASWVAEYGDPDVAADRAFIAKYSAYQNLKPGEKYPEPYITTNTEDDRVHPGHARKFAAKLQALHDPYLYYENTFGGHANDADPNLNARRWARHYVYLDQKLVDHRR